MGFSVSAKLRNIRSQVDRQKQAETKRLQEQTDLANELARQAQNRQEKINLSSSLNDVQGEHEANNDVGSKGSVLSRLRAVKAIIGTPNSDMGTGDMSLGTFFKKTFFN